ncbi:MAG: Rpn family recombination-promoting nuclease/putative transposase [Deltaproteobacteria bacterium]|nr:Rpn family recombination-promoting nuclease/putative transposase [Deltaproteobacteria bacterium]
MHYQPQTQWCGTCFSVRILTYLGLLYQDLIRTKQTAVEGKLPPVLPVVLYNGKRPWEASTEISDLVQHAQEGWSVTGPSGPEPCSDPDSFFQDQNKKSPPYANP